MIQFTLLLLFCVRIFALEKYDSLNTSMCLCIFYFQFYHLSRATCTNQQFNCIRFDAYACDIHYSGILRLFTYRLSSSRTNGDHPNVQVKRKQIPHKEKQGSKESAFQYYDCKLKHSSTENSEKYYFLLPCFSLESNPLKSRINKYIIFLSSFTQ